MKKIFAQALLCILVLSVFLFPPITTANDKEKKITGIAKDCEFLYLLMENEIQKFTLPNFTLTKSVDIPSGNKGRDITIAGGCSDPNETILVFAKRKGSSSDRVLLSYNEDLELISQLALDNEINNDDDDDDENDD